MIIDPNVFYITARMKKARFVFYAKQITEELCKKVKVRVVESKSDSRIATNIRGEIGESKILDLTSTSWEIFPEKSREDKGIRIKVETTFFHGHYKRLSGGLDDFVCLQIFPYNPDEDFFARVKRVWGEALNPFSKLEIKEEVFDDPLPFSPYSQVAKNLMMWVL